MSLGWGDLAWRGLPLILVLAWFLGLVGGYGLGGLLHLLLLGAVAVFGYQAWSDSST